MRRTTTALIALAASLTLAGCDRTSDPSTVDLPTSTPTASASGSGHASHSAAGVEVAVRYANGQVSPKGLVAKVKQGERVRLVVVSDVAGEVHVHGYDLKEEITGGRVSFDFLADIPGSFEVELEGKDYLLLTLQVS